MRRTLASFALAIALSGAQAGLLLHLGGGALPLCLPLALVCWAAVEGELVEGLATAVAVGWVLDVFAGTPRGLLVFQAVVALLLCRLARSSLAVHGRIGFGLLTGGAVTAAGLGALLLTRLTAPDEARPGAGLVGRVFLEALATALAAGLLQGLLVRLERLLVREPDPGILSR